MYFAKIVFKRSALFAQIAENIAIIVRDIIVPNTMIIFVQIVMKIRRMIDYGGKR